MRTLTLLALVFLALPAHADEVQFGRLGIEFPEGWVPSQPEQGKPATIIPKGFEGRAVLQMHQPVSLKGVEVADAVRQILNNVDTGRKVISAVEIGNGGWFANSNGIMIHAAAQKSADAEGNERVALLWGIPAGDQLYCALLMTTDGLNLPKIIEPFQQTLMKLSVTFPADSGPPAFGPGSTRGNLLHAKFAIPKGVSLGSQSDSSNLLYHRTVVFGEKESAEIPFRIRLHSGTPTNARRLLVHWLLSADWSIKANEGTTHSVVLQRDLQPKGGLPTSVVVVQVAKGQEVVDKRIGFLVHGKGWSVLVGAAHDMGAYEGLQEEWKEALSAERTQTMSRLYQIASSVRIPLVKVTARADIDAFLIQRKKHSWRYELNYSSGGDSTHVENYVRWTFFPDRSCTVERNSFLGSNSIAREPGPGVPAIGGTSTLSFAEGKGPAGKSLFMCFEWEGKAYILLTPTSGMNSIHSLEPEAKGSFGDSKDYVGVAIDGRIEGEYSTGNGHKFRTAPGAKK